MSMMRSAIDELTGESLDQVPDAVLEQDLAEIRAAIEALEAQFVRRVAEGRGLGADVIAGSAEGRIFAGPAAQAAKLVDDWGGLERAVRAAKEMAHHGVRVNAIQPGLIRSAMTEAMPQKAWDQKMSEIPMGRPGEVDEIASVALFLASDMSSYVTGAVLEVTGGRFM